MNVFAIERRNEGAVETIDDLMRDLIGLVLQPLMARHGACGVGAAWKSCRKCSTAFLVPSGDFGEQI